MAEPTMDENTTPNPVPRWKERLQAFAARPGTPYFLAGALCLVAVGVAFSFRPPVWLRSAPSVVVFDPVKFANAQRAVASVLIATPSADNSLILTQVAKQSEAVIKAEARGALVLIKQAVVVADDVPDITDAVLEHFGLPTKVPTVTVKPGDSIETLAPTNAAFSSGKLREDYRMELENRLGKMTVDAAKAQAQTDTVP